MNLQKIVLLVLVFVLLPASGGVINAQPVQCTASSGVPPPVIRAEGIAEMLADFLVQCTGGTAGIQMSVDVRLFLSDNVTNNRDFGKGAAITDALLIINENYCPVGECEPQTTSTGFGSGSNPGSRNPLPQYGRLVAFNMLEWSGVVFPVPGPAGVTTMRIGNVRAKAPPLSNTPIPSPTVGFLGISAPGIVINNPQQTMAYAQPGLSTTLLPRQGSETFVVRLTEGFQIAFKPLGTPTTQCPGCTGAEAGYPTPGSGVNDGGVTQGTRLALRFSGVFQGVRLVVPGSLTRTNGFGKPLTLVRIFDTDANGTGGTPGPSKPDLVHVEDGSGLVVYEVTSSEPTQTDSIDVPVLVCPGSLGPPRCLVQAATRFLHGMRVNASLAPLSAVITSDPVAPEPRFMDTSSPLDVGAVVSPSGKQ